MNYPRNRIMRPWTRDELRRLALVLEDRDIPLSMVAARFGRSLSAIKDAQRRLRIRRHRT